MHIKFFKNYFYGIISIACILISITVNAQFNIQMMGDDGIPHNLEFHDANGTPIPIGVQGDIEGSPLFNDQWGYGIIQFRNGVTFTDSTVGFSLYNGRLFFENRTKIYSIDYPVEAFLLGYLQDSNENKIYSFKNGFPAINENDSLTFYEILYGGTSFKLLKLLQKKVEAPYSYGIIGHRKYSLYQEYFIFLSKENKMIELGKNPKEKILIKKLPKFTDQIKSYTSTHKLNIKNDDDLIQLFSFLDWEALNKSYAFSFKNFFSNQNFQTLSQLYLKK